MKLSPQPSSVHKDAPSRPDTRQASKAAFALWLAALTGAVFFLGLWRHIAWTSLVFKPIPVLCLAYWIAGEKRDRYATRIAIGLALSAFGDLFNETGEATFLLAVIAFLLAHIGYILAFLQRSRALSPLYALPFVLWGVVAYIVVLPHLREMTGPAVIYMVVLCSMMWRAVAAYVARPSDVLRRAGAIGALLFGISDTLIALNKWHAPIPAASFLIMAFYWAGQTGIALSAKRTYPQPPPEAGRGF